MTPSSRCRFASAVPLVLLVFACGFRKEVVDQRPERVVEEFIGRMQRVHGNPKSAREAYELLWSEAQQNLAERAKRASALAGRKVAPEEMLAPSRFSLLYKPTRYEARVQGEWALVTVTGDVAATHARTIKCVREEGAWRVVLELPQLPAIKARDDAGL